MTLGAIARTQAEMQPEEFKRFQAFLKKTSGIHLTDNKQYLVKNRLTGLMRSLQINTFGDLVRMLEQGSQLKLRQQVVDAMTTNETFWFRDPVHFQVLLEELLPELSQSKMGRPRIWSAACSSGQEPYSMSLLVQEALELKKLKQDVEIVGTDISHAILENAKLGTYTEIELMRGLPDASRQKNFQSVRDGWQLKPALRQRVRFRQFNLLENFSSLGKFDVIFCRNVLIYFSDSLKADILTRMADTLNPGGLLFLSSTEALPQSVDRFEKVFQSGCRFYRQTK